MTLPKSRISFPRMTKTLISWSVKAARKLLAAGREQTKVICGAIAKIAFKVGTD